MGRGGGGDGRAGRGREAMREERQHAVSGMMREGQYNNFYLVPYTMHLVFSTLVKLRYLYSYIGWVG